MAGQPFLELRSTNGPHRVRGHPLLEVQEPKERSRGGKLPSDGPLRETSAIAGTHERAEGQPIDIRIRPAPLRACEVLPHEIPQVSQVPPIGRQRVGRKLAFVGKMPEEVVDLLFRPEHGSADRWDRLAQKRNTMLAHPREEILLCTLREHLPLDTLVLHTLFERVDKAPIRVHRLEVAGNRVP